MKCRPPVNYLPYGRTRKDPGECDPQFVCFAHHFYLQFVRDRLLDVSKRADLYKQHPMPSMAYLRELSTNLAIRRKR
jgi:hypothetical protein